MGPPLLYGQDPTTGIVGLHPTPDGRMRVYRRERNTTRFTDEPFFPFFFLADAHDLQGFRPRHWVKPLEGSLYYSSLCVFENWSAMWEAVRFLLDAHNRAASRRLDSHAALDILYLSSDPVSQYLLQTGRTLFKGMKLRDLRRLHIMVNPPGGRPPTSSRSSAPRTSALTLSDCRGWTSKLEFRHPREALAKFIDIVRERDPDLIQAESFYQNVLRFLMDTASRSGSPLRIGRDGSDPFRSTTRGGGTIFPVGQVPWEIAGRHILDMREEQPEEHSPDGPVEPRGGHSTISRAPVTPPDGVRVSSVEDLVREIAESEPHVRKFFFLSQIAPSSFGSARYPGFLRRFEHILVREYLRTRHSLPAPARQTIPSPISTRLFYTGLLGPVIDLEIRGFHYTAFAEAGVSSRGDPGGVFSQLVRTLIAMAHGSDERQAASAGTDQEGRLEGVHSLLKETFAYLASGRMLFGDPALAHRILLSLSPMLEAIATHIRAQGGKVVEIDEEGMLVVPPEGPGSPEDETTFIEKISADLPRGVEIHIRGRYRKVLCFRKHNHAFLRYDQTYLLRGFFLHPRGIEQFGRVFLDHCIHSLLNHDIQRMHNLYAEIRSSILQRTWNTRDFARVETLSDSLETYSRELSEGKRKKSAAYEVAVAGKHNLPPGSRIAYYVTGNDPNARAYDHCRPAEEWDPHFPDENTAYYLRRLDEFAGRFSAFFEPGDFRSIFTADELFPFDPSGIVAITLPVREEGEEDAGGHGAEFGIWIDE